MRVFLNGDFEGYKNFKVQETKQQKILNGYEIRMADGTDKDLNVDRLTEMSMFDPSPILIILQNAHKLKKEECLKLVECDPNIELILIGTGKLKADKGLTVQTIDTPKDLNEWCAGFVVDILKKEELTIKEDLAKAIVTRIGTDVGYLYSECMKYKYACQSKEVQPKEIAGVMAILGEEDGTKIIDALKSFDVRAVIKSMDDLQRTKKEDPTMSFVAGLLTYNLCLWFEIACLSEQGKDAKGISETLKVHPFVVEKFHLPFVKKISLKKIIELIKLANDCEYSVLAGERDAWTRLKCGIIKILFI
jgi:DNA polymerase III delta subunit